MRPTRLLRPAVAAISLLFLSAACTGDPDPEPRAVRTVPTLSPEEVRDAVESFDPGDPTTAHLLSQAGLHGRGQAETLAPLLVSRDDNRRWAALYVLTLSVKTVAEAEPLVPLLQDPLPTLRVVAAGALSGLGFEESLPVLIAGLSLDRALPYSDPPRLASDLAREALEAFTGEDFESMPEWEAWLEDAGPLRWDGERYVAS